MQLFTMMTNVRVANVLDIIISTSLGQIINHYEPPLQNWGVIKDETTWYFGIIYADSLKDCIGQRENVNLLNKI